MLSYCKPSASGKAPAAHRLYLNGAVLRLLRSVSFAPSLLLMEHFIGIQSPTRFFLSSLRSKKALVFLFPYSSITFRIFLIFRTPTWNLNFFNSVCQVFPGLTVNIFPEPFPSGGPEMPSPGGCGGCCRAAPHAGPAPRGLSLGPP